MNTEMISLKSIAAKCLNATEPAFDLLGCDYEQIVKAGQFLDLRLQGIYFLIEGNEIVYIGQTKNFYSRIFSHHVYTEKYKVSFLYVPNDLDLDIIESFYIQKYEPKLNRKKTGPMSIKNLENAIKKRLSSLMTNELMKKEPYNQCVQGTGG